MLIYRSDMHTILPSFGGIALPASYTADTCTLGGITVDSQYYHGAGMGPGQAAGGLRAPSDITITMIWADTSYPFAVALYNAAGLTTASVAITPLTFNKTSASQKPLTYTGLLGTVTPPEVERASSNLIYLTATINPNEGVANN